MLLTSREGLFLVKLGLLRNSLIHFISMDKVKDILRVEALWLQRFIFTLFLVDKVKDILRVEARWLRDSFFES